MLKCNTQLISLTALLVLITACNSTPETNSSKMGMNIPSWVTNPTAEAGLAAASCVVASNSFSMDKAQATTQARVELASQLDTRIATLQEEYSEKLTTADETTTNTKFITTTTQLTDQALQGSKAVKVDYAQIGEQRNLCALVTLADADAKSLFKKVMKKAPVKLEPDNEALLYLNFIKSENSPK